MTDTTQGTGGEEALAGDPLDIFDSGTGLAAEAADTTSVGGGEESVDATGGESTVEGGAGEATTEGTGSESTVAGTEGQDTIAGSTDAASLAKAFADELEARGKKADTTEDPDGEYQIIPADQLIAPGEDGYAEQQLQILNFQRVNDNVNNSERFARMGPDKEIVDDVKKWTLARFETDAAFAQKVIYNPDPYGVATQMYKDEVLLKGAKDANLNPQELSEFEEFRAWKKAKADAEALGAGGSTTTTTEGSTGGSPSAVNSVGKPAATAKPPKSIADLPAAGKGGNGHVPTSPGSAFDSAFVN